MAEELRKIAAGGRMRTFLVALFLAIVLSLLSGRFEERAKRLFRRRPHAIWAVPVALTALFAAVLAFAGAFRPAFLALVALYLFVPCALVWAGTRRSRPAPSWFELGAVLALWLPVEFAAGRSLLPREAWSVANLVARGSSITLALALFLLFAEWKEMKYRLPRRWSDLVWPAAGFVVLVPVLVVLGLELGFMGPLRAPLYSAGGIALVWLKTLAGVALPEEILFRALIQNWLMQRFGFTYRTLAVAALVFGAAHLNNPPGPLPNWRYMLLASIAGFVFGNVFWRSGSVLSSAGLHAAINTVRHVFFL